MKFTTAEYYNRGTKLRRDLTNKTFVHQLLRDKTLGGQHIGLPTQHAILTSPEQITDEVLGERVALKFAHGWSAKGVMLLERIGEHQYFDHMSLRERSLDNIRRSQQAILAKFPKKKAAWIVEDFLQGAQPGGVPYDYKFYMFQDQIGVVAQIDRNSSPLRAVMLDGNLKPLTLGRDYWTGRNDTQLTVPLVPRSAVMLSRWAIELAKMTDAPFSRIDLYDTVDGPYFGEFTFSTGAEIKGRVTYSRAIDDHLDELFNEAQRELNGETVTPRDTFSTALQTLEPEVIAAQPVMDLQQYQRYAYYLHNQGSLGGYRLAQAQQALVEHGAEETINRYVVDAHHAARRSARRLGAPPSNRVTQQAKRVYRKVSKLLPV
ncbi:ATP-grasp fold amidoligase family protein [Nesterenkonia massiliensis]|uniref:ATP-grasp fold amidoligase family protein n=1 Tax=Nesterenkonia massiliensis TaxID=1232429 RepID=UPI000410FDD7|nr:ATP-grasp fold amidoligase family protein [Nesterenkonia massiliensis]